MWAGITSAAALGGCDAGSRLAAGLTDRLAVPVSLPPCGFGETHRLPWNPRCAMELSTNLFRLSLEYAYSKAFSKAVK